MNVLRKVLVLWPVLLLSACQLSVEKEPVTYVAPQTEPIAVEPPTKPVAPPAPTPVRPIRTQSEIFDSERLATLKAEIQEAIAEGKLPGGVLWIDVDDQLGERLFEIGARVNNVASLSEEQTYPAAQLFQDFPVRAGES